MEFQLRPKKITYKMIKNFKQRNCKLGLYCIMVKFDSSDREFSDVLNCC
jgi:hypothetical protein